MLSLARRLRDDKRNDTDVLAYLEAENKYKDAVLKDTQPLQVGPAGEVGWGDGVG
jgi:hypothetical protein